MLSVDGVLDSTTYLPLRDAIIEAALDGSRAVVVDTTALRVPAPSAWAVFTSARWHVSQWPDVPIVLVCAHAGGRDTIRRNGITRYVPAYASTRDALEDLPSGDPHRYRRRAGAELETRSASVPAARELMRRWLTAWGQAQFIAVVSVVGTVLMENAVAYTDGALWLRLESNGATVTVAVTDTSRVAAVRREPAGPCGGVSGLDIVASFCRRWGNSPAPPGKTVWAVIGPQDLIG